MPDTTKYRKPGGGNLRLSYVTVLHINRQQQETAYCWEVQVTGAECMCSHNHTFE